jgi:bifunctional enzyme CysN/CysC
LTQADSRSKGSKSRLRVLTCGSVDDGKSTLIGRLLFDCDQIPDDLLASTRAHSKNGTLAPEGLDFAFLLDGLEAEREQGITIDVSYRSFATPARACQIADCPGHAQYTRNMVTAASNCEAAIVLIDARRGMLEQTQRHMRICAMMGITAIAIAINKMDLCDWSKDTFEVIAKSAKSFGESLEFESVTLIPVSALSGGNVASRSVQSPWYQGNTLLEWLEQVNCVQSSSHATRLPVQSVGRPDQDTRTYFGTLLGGKVETGQSLFVGQSGVEAKVVQIYDAGVLVEQAQTRAAIGITLDRHIDLTRGDVLCDDPSTTLYTAQLVADVIWFSPSPMVPGRSYWFKGPGAWVQGAISRLKHKVGMETGAEIAANVLEMNEIGCVNVATAAPMLCDTYAQNRLTGGFLIVDTQSNETLGAGLIKYALRRSAFITPETAAIDSNSRAQRYNHKPLVVWLTGLSGSGKSTIAKLSEQNLWARHFATTLLDGDNLRGGLNQDLGFTEFDRVENVRRTAEVAKLMADAGMVVFCALISPFARDRDMARTIIGADRFVEVFINTPVNVCAQRDPKGLYAKAYAGLIPNFTGVSSPYEEPNAPDIAIETASLSPDDAAAKISLHIVNVTRLDDFSSPSI